MTISMLIVFLQRHLKVPKSLFAIDFVLSDIGSESADKKKYHLNIPDNNQATAKREDGLCYQMNSDNVPTSRDSILEICFGVDAYW